MDSGNPQRRNLIVISYITILIEIAGGKFIDGATPFGAIKIDRPEFLQYSMWLYLFAAFRYWQSIKSPSVKQLTYQYKKNLDGLLSHNEKYRQLFTKLLSTTRFASGKDAPSNPAIHRGIFKRYIDFRYQQEYPNFTPPSDLPVFKVSFKTLLPMEIKAHLKLIFIESLWFDVIFPWFITILAVSIVIVNRLINN